MKDQRIFSSELLEEIHRRSRGIPRLINLICDNLLVTAFAMETKVVTLEMLDEVSTDLRIEWPGSNRGRGRSRYSMAEDATPEQSLPISRD
jgi:general secretion pathway protein A